MRLKHNLTIELELPQPCCKTPDKIFLQTIKIIGAGSCRLIQTKKETKTMKRIFIGIDFCNLKFDVAIFAGSY